MVGAAEKKRTEYTSEFDVADMGQAEGAALHWLLLLEPSSMTATELAD